MTARDYPCTVHREGDWWVIDVEGVGVTQCAEWASIAPTARDLVALIRDIDAADVHVSVIGAAR